MGRCNVVVAIHECSTLPEASVVGSNDLVWYVVCSDVVGASQSILNISVGLLLRSEIMSNNGHI